MCAAFQTFVYLFCKTTLILLLSDLMPQNINLLGFKPPQSLSRTDPEELEQDNNMLEKQEFGFIWGHLKPHANFWAQWRLEEDISILGMTIPSPLLRAVYEVGECIYLWPAAITFIVLLQHCDEHTSALAGLSACLIRIPFQVRH